jgi:SnoaL-like domain
VSDTPGAGPSTAAEQFVHSLAEAWRSPSHTVLVERVRPLFAPTVRLSQPLWRTTRGLDGFERHLTGLQAIVPDLQGRVVGWAAAGEVLYVEFELTGTIARKRLRLRSCDRIVLRDGLAIERHAFIDLLPLLCAIATRPTVWPRAVRSLLRLHSLRTRFPS